MRKITLLILTVSLLPFISCNNTKQTKAEMNLSNQQTPKNEANTPKEAVSKIMISTKFGDIKIKLYNETPLHRDNMVKLVSEGYYDGTLFHRVINNFMIQGGDPDSKNAPAGKMLGNGGPDYTIPAEFNPSLFHKKGALAAARTGDQVNPQKASSGSQFYIVHGQVFNEQQLMSMGKTYTPEQISVYTSIGGTPHLDGGYTIFGEVYEGLEIIDIIARVKTGVGDRPLEDVSMTIKLID